MAVAWTASRLGSASADVLVRDPVVMSLTAPRFLAIGDRTSIAVSVHNLDAPGGAYELAVSADGPIEAGAGEPETLALSQGARLERAVAITATGAGTATVDVTITGRPGRSRAAFPSPSRPPARS